MFMRTKPYWTLFGVARGGCPTRRPDSPKGWHRPARRGSGACRPCQRLRTRAARTGVAHGSSVRACPTSTPPPPLPCTPWPGRPCSPALDEGWADPARLYREGRRARLLLDAAREAAAEAVGCRPDELVFTPSGTRAVHAGIAGALAGRRRVGRHLVVSAVEHSSVLHAADAHEAATAAR